MEGDDPADADVRATAALLVAAAGLLGVGFGALAREAGVGAAVTVGAAAVTFMPSAQLSLLAAWEAGAGPVIATAGALSLAARMAALAVVVGDRLAWRGWRRVAAAHVVIDASVLTALLRSDRTSARRTFVRVGVAAWSAWTCGALVGHLAGAGLDRVPATVVDATVAALFAGLVPALAAGRGGLVAAVAGGVIAVVLLPLGAGVAVLGGATGAIAGHAAGRHARGATS